MVDKTSACFWFPRIRDAGLTVPRTEIVPYDHARSIMTFEGNDNYCMPIEIKEAAERIGYPVFIRTDQASAKHNGPHAFKAENLERLIRCFWMTVEDSELKLWLSATMSAIMVREWLDLDAPFEAFGGLAISREWRFFANEHQVFCHHFYWPAEAIEFYGRKEPDDWRHVLRDMGLICPPSTVAALSVQAADVCGGGDWSGGNLHAAHHHPLRRVALEAQVAAILLVLSRDCGFG